MIVTTEEDQFYMMSGLLRKTEQVFSLCPETGLMARNYS